MTRHRYPHHPPEGFAALAHEALVRAGVFARADEDMIVLERIASGAGATNWYNVHGADTLSALTRRLWPGSSVSFFFDNRIAKTVYDASARAALEAWWTRDYDAVLLTLIPDDFELDYWGVAGHQDLVEREGDGDLKDGDPIHIGPYPASDNDTGAITIYLPDKDGIVRPHAY